MSVKCVNGSMDGGAHEFNTPMSAGDAMEPLLYCQRCGEVRRLEVAPPDDSPPFPSQRREDSNVQWAGSDLSSAP